MQSLTEQQTWSDWRKRFNSLEQRGRVQILFEQSFKFEQYSAGYNKELVYLKTPSTVEKCIYPRNITKLRGKKMCIARKDPLNLTARLRTDNSHLNIFFHDHLTSPAHSMYLIQYRPVHIAKKTPSFCGTASSQWRYLTCYHQEEVLWNLGWVNQTTDGL